MAGTLAWLSAQSGCIVTDCDLWPATPECTAIKVMSPWLSRNKPAALTVQFLDADSTAALAEGMQPTFSLRRLLTAMGSGQSAPGIIASSALQIKKESDDVISWEIAGDAAAALKMYTEPLLELRAQLPEHGESNAFPVHLCSTLGFVQPMEPLIVDRDRSSYRVGIRPGLSSSLAVQLCNGEGSCTVEFYHFDAQLKKLTLEKGDCIASIPKSCEIAAHGEDILASCEEDKKTGDGKVQNVYIYRKDPERKCEETQNPGMKTNGRTSEGLLNTFDPPGRFYSSAGLDFFVLANARSLRVVTVNPLTEPPVLYSMISAMEAPYGAIGDFTGDGTTDIILVPRLKLTQTSLQDAVLLTQADGMIYPVIDRTLALRKQLQAVDPSRILGLAAGDMDGDNQADLVIYEGPSLDPHLDPHLRVLASSPCRSPEIIQVPSRCLSPTKPNEPSNKPSIVIGDIDGDHDQDVVLANSEGPEICVLLNTTFSP